MGVLRLVAIAALVLGVLWLLRRLTGGGAVKRRARSDAPPAHAADSGATLMVVCARCGVHLPAADALPGRAQPEQTDDPHARTYYCCAAHRDGPSA